MSKSNTFWIFAIIILVIWLMSAHSKLQEKDELISDLEDENYRLEAQVSDYGDALQEANSQIEEANSMIEDAQGYAWSSYEDMGYALDDLSTVDTISEP